jgi:hypothetical protein
MSAINRSTESQARRGVRRSVVAGLGAATVTLLLAAPASAAQPNHQACLGEDMRTYATGGAGCGAFVSGMATTTGGVGEEIQAHLAGEIPDELQPNTCND